MRKIMMAGNWKMNKKSTELSGFFETFSKEASLNEESLAKVDILFAVPFTLLESSQKLANKSGIQIASQNINENESGAFTGEISHHMLSDIGIKATLIGHSERRQYYNESDESVANKVVTAQKNGLLAVACVGELLEEREGGKTSEVVTRQVNAFLDKIDSTDNLVIAYEPVWAIGTGKTATPEMAQEVHALIRGLVNIKFGQESSDKMQILYGGSAKPSNIDELLSQPDIDGGLVGGASLKPLDFAQMVRSGLK
jgi:triosephosphate isomerase (TIM)